MGREPATGKRKLAKLRGGEVQVINEWKKAWAAAGYRPQPLL
jgi:hypothetical protein